MSTVTPLLTQSVEKGIIKLLDHFKEQYGGMIFIPLGVNSKTPTKLAPGIAESIQTHLLEKREEGVVILSEETKIGIIFDSFMESFFNSLNFIAKGVMKTLGMKLSWNDFYKKFEEYKINDLKAFERWKKNLTTVLVALFKEVILGYQQNGDKVFISDGEQYFSSIDEAIANLELFKIE